MTTGHVYIATSLDGFVARSDHSLDWLTKQPTSEGQGDMGYAAFMASVDGLVMGRGSFTNLLGLLDLGPEGDAEAWPYKKPVVVVSRSLKAGDVPAALRERVRIVDLEPAALMDHLAEQGWSRAYVDGGLLVQSFLRAGLIEDMILTTIPILIGVGKRLFGELPGDIDLELVRSEAFENGMVQSHYRLLASGGAPREGAGVEGE